MHADAAAYALTSMDAAELTEVEAHLATCTVCQQEVAEFCETAAELSLLTQATPPPRLRSNILAAIQNVPQLPAAEENHQQPGTPATPIWRTSADGRTSTDLRTRPARPTGPRRALPDSEVADEPEPPRVDELELRRPRRRNRILRGLVAATLIVAVGLGGVVYTLVQQRQTQVAQLAQRAQEEQVVRAPDARLLVVPLDNGGRCTFVVSAGQNRALFLGTNMPDPGPGLQYQLWTLTDGTPVLDNPVPNARPWRQLFRGNMAEADEVAITIEEAGSTPAAPNLDRLVMRAELPA